MSSSVAVFPSFAESFGIAPIESMVCECPTIYSKFGPVPFIIDGIDGLLIDPDNPAEIAVAIQTLLTNPILSSRIGQLGRQKIETSFSKEIMTQQSLEFYQKCIQKFVELKPIITCYKE